LFRGYLKVVISIHCGAPAGRRRRRRRRRMYYRGGAIEERTERLLLPTYNKPQMYATVVSASNRFDRNTITRSSHQLGPQTGTGAQPVDLPAHLRMGCNQKLVDLVDQGAGDGKSNV
jgi:hypothetical protein